MVESWASSPTARKVMQGNRGRDTKPELAVRRILHARGLRYRVNARVEPDLRRTADLLFSGARVAVFIDGCFWHGCPEHYTASRTHPEYWSAKIAGNMSRDAETKAILEARGWTVLRLWSHVSATNLADVIESAVRVND